MQIEIVGTKPTICNEDFLGVRRFLSVSKVADSFMLILEPSSLYLGIDIFAGNQVIECHKVDGEVSILPSDIGIPVPIGMEGEPGAITGNQLMALEQCRRAACIIELVQQRRKCILGEFAALLDIRRFGGCILRRDSLADMEVTNFFRQTAFGGGDLEQEQSLKGQLAIPDKVFAWVLGKIRGCHCANGTHQARRVASAMFIMSLLVISG